VALGGEKELVLEGIKNDADDNGLLDGQGDGNAGEGEAVHEVGGACLFLGGGVFV